MTTCQHPEKIFLGGSARSKFLVQKPEFSCSVLNTGFPKVSRNHYKPMTHKSGDRPQGDVWRWRHLAVAPQQVGRTAAFAAEDADVVGDVTWAVTVFVGKNETYYLCNRWGTSMHEPATKVENPPFAFPSRLSGWHFCRTGHRTKSYERKRRRRFRPSAKWQWGCLSSL